MVNFMGFFWSIFYVILLLRYFWICLAMTDSPSWYLADVCSTIKLLYLSI